MLHRFDIHTHTFFSKDAIHAPERLIASAKKQGLSGIVITDHNTCEAHAYLKKQGLQREDGLPVDGFLVIPGVEVSTAEGHLLCIGATLPHRLGQPAIDVCKEILACGGIPIPAHPFDKFRAGMGAKTLDTLPIQLIEGFNAAISWHPFNEKAKQYAKARGLLTTAGSDAHHDSAIGIATTSVEIDTLSVDAFLKALVEKPITKEAYLPFKEGIKKHFHNWFRFLNPKVPDDLHH